ncbi:MAG: histidine kinase dimerization/phospho-acceptor domain-containing protein, partial [Myxococcota bacterium]
MQEPVKTIEREFEERNAPVEAEVANLRAALRESERARQRAEGRYRSLYENSPDLLVSVDLATDAIVLCNRTLEVKLGVPRDRLVGSSVFGLFSRSSQRRVRRLLSHSNHAAPRDNIAVVLLTRTAAEIPAQLTVRYELDGSGVRHAHCTLRDLSDVQKTRALEQLAERLERSNEDLERFALVASHDLLEPLRAIKGFVGILESRISSRLDSEDRIYLERTLEGADRMERLIDGLLSVAKVNHDPIDAKPVELDRTLEQVSSVFAERLEACGGRVNAEHLPRVLGDAAQLQRVF